MAVRREINDVCSIQLLGWYQQYNDALEGTCNINLEVGPILTNEWVDLMACKSEWTESVLSMLLRWTSVQMAENDWSKVVDQF